MTGEPERRVVGVWPKVEIYKRLMRVKETTGLSASTLLANLLELHIDELEELTAEDVRKLKREIADELAAGVGVQKAAAAPARGGAEAGGGPPREDSPVPQENEDGFLRDRAPEGGEVEELTGEEAGAEEDGQGPHEAGEGRRTRVPARGDSPHGGEPAPAEDEVAPQKPKRGRPRKRK